jgi:hypothetical protein
MREQPREIARRGKLFAAFLGRKHSESLMAHLVGIIGLVANMIGSLMKDSQRWLHARHG